jgi:AcrR family transcriptional regulator
MLILSWRVTVSVALQPEPVMPSHVPTPDNTAATVKAHTMVPRPDLTRRLTQAFLDYGYDQLNMTGLAQAADMTRRSLYNYFSNKEEAFRFVIDQANAQGVSLGMAAGRAKFAAGTDAIGVLSEIINVRYGENRRRLMASPHAIEINDQAFRRCRDLMIASALSFQAQLADMIVELEAAGRLRRKAGMTPEAMAQLLADGARGTNQALPPIAGEHLAERYRQMVAALLFGMAHVS